MKILHLNRADTEGGAARAATRLLEGIRLQGDDAQLFVQRKVSNSPYVSGPPAMLGKAIGFARRKFESCLFGLSAGKLQGLFSPAFLPDRLPARVSAVAPDVIHLHWVARMMRLETLLRFSMPIVWTLHDSWPFTGGCFLPPDCTRYRDSCGKCPVLGSSREKDLSRRVWERKRAAWQNLNLTIVAPSRWMGGRARGSSLFRDTRIEVIPNGLDVNRYRPFDKRAAREFLDLPQDKRLILFGAKDATQDRNKGFHLFIQALHRLSASGWRDRFEVVLFGSPALDLSPDMRFKVHSLGWQNDEVSLARLYSAADVFVFPSLQETLGYAAMEAMACETPCVAFDQGGVPDLIDHEQNGYLARPFEPADLARGIAWVLEDDRRRGGLSERARGKVEREFAMEKVAARHRELYREILTSSRDQNDPNWTADIK